MYLIGEIGINHNGDLNNAIKLIHIAKQAGCNCVKFQKRNPDICVPEEKKNKEKIFLGKKMTYLEYKKQIEFNKQEYDIINKTCKEVGIDWTVSVWDIDSFNFMLQYKNDIPFLKIPSACITNISLLNEIKKTSIPVVISNGMSTQAEVDKAISILNKNLIGILHCNSSYPSQINELDLNVISTYKKLYNVTIGYSGHEIGYFPTLLAYTLGADIIERHITLDNNMEGTDQKVSLNPKQLIDMIQKLKEIDNILGSFELKCYPSEKIIQKKLRQF